MSTRTYIAGVTAIICCALLAMAAPSDQVATWALIVGLAVLATLAVGLAGLR